MVVLPLVPVMPTTSEVVRGVAVDRGGHRSEDRPRVVDDEHRQPGRRGTLEPEGSVSTATAPASTACATNSRAVGAEAGQGGVQVAGHGPPRESWVTPVTARLGVGGHAASQRARRPPRATCVERERAASTGGVLRTRARPYPAGHQVTGMCGRRVPVGRDAQLLEAEGHDLLEHGAGERRRRSGRCAGSAGRPPTTSVGFVGRRHADERRGVAAVAAARVVDAVRRARLARDAVAGDRRLRCRALVGHDRLEHRAHGLRGRAALTTRVELGGGRRLVGAVRRRCSPPRASARRGRRCWRWSRRPTPPAPR